METLRATAERMSPQGQALCRAEGTGRVVFVAHAVPGDELEVEVLSSGATFAMGRIRRILKPGPGRQIPPCPLHFDPSRSGPACGGCDWQQFSYPAQLEHKRAVVVDALRRIARMPETPVAPTLASPKEWGYRNKVQVPFGSNAGSLIAGFYESGSHRIVDLAECAVQPPVAVRLTLKVKQLAAACRLAPYDEKSGRGWLRHLLVRTNSAGKALATIVSRTPEFPRRTEFLGELRASFPELIGLWHNVQPEKTSVILGPGWRRIWGAPTIEETLGPFRFLCSPSSFLQVNTPACEVLYNAVSEALREGGRQWSCIVDVYSGVGTISLWIARHARGVIGIEESRPAVQDAIANAKLNGVRNVRFHAGRAEALLPRILKDAPDPCAVVADPPRRGLAVPVLRHLTSRRISRLVYVSCDPATFARDAGYLAKSGFALKRVSPVDLFPQTSHVELVGLFDRS